MVKAVKTKVKQGIKFGRNLSFLKGWKTVILNTSLAILPGVVEVAGQVLNVTELQGLIPPTYLPLYLAGVGVTNVILRSVTNTPVGKKI